MIDRHRKHVRLRDVPISQRLERVGSAEQSMLRWAVRGAGEAKWTSVEGVCGPLQSTTDPSKKVI